jgi:glycerophosphoryl diester phosphodiesterase
MECRTIGHRGAKGLAPENTLKALRTGFERADAAECDVSLSSDGALAVIHDGSLMRRIRVRGRVKDFTMAALSSFEAGDGEKLPALGDVISLALSFSKPLVVEIKTFARDNPRLPAEALKKTLLSFPALPEIMVCSFNHDTLKHFRNLMPEITIIATIRRGMSRDEICAVIDSLAPEGVSVDFRSLTPSLAAAIKEKGVFLQAWVVNTAKDFMRMARMGVDWVYTDFPGKFGREA